MALWEREPTPERLAKIAARAAAASEAVPAARRDDWERLVARLTRADARRAERVAALGRACALFAGPPPPLPIDAPVSALAGLGPTAEKELAVHGVTSVFDLLWTLPVAYDDLTSPLSVAAALATAREAATAGAPPPRLCVVGTVKSANVVNARGRRFVSVIVTGEGSALTASWFFVAGGVLQAATRGASCLLLGRVRVDDRGRARMAHPDLARDTPEARAVRPRYPRLGVSEAALRKGALAALARTDAAVDPVPREVATRERLGDARALLESLHAPGKAVPTIAVRRAGLERLAFAEGFTRAWQRLVAEGRAGEAPLLPLDRAALARLRAELGFPLTAGQEAAIHAIGRDLATTRPMRRLLLGDVGTGKTAVALAAAAQCVAAGYQAAILAPTGVLAEQTMDALGPLARASGAKVVLVTASRDKALGAISDGAVDVAVGTHALLGDAVRFARLGLVVVDEQHRLGVAQRVALVRKGASPHLLTLSATPIPRSLALALRGELATSTLEERPAGRLPVETIVLADRERPRVEAELREVAARGERAFVICPRIDPLDEEEDDVPNARDTAAELTASLAPAKVHLLHGAQKPEEQRRGMRAFRRGEVDVLVATTVVEVGVDVPEATRMVVLGAERFGLAQLHQLRGRVGRGERRGRCILVHGPLDALASRRLEAIRALATGHEVALADLELRGAGDLSGTRQSGVEEELLYLDPTMPPAWLARLEGDARAIHNARDPDLTAVEHRALALATRRFARALATRDAAG